MASKSRRSAGERVLEGRHVIGLFVLVLLFSGLFFTLGYVMGRNQFDGQVRAENTPRNFTNIYVPVKTSTKTNADAPTTDSNGSAANNAPASSDWDFYKSSKDSAPETDLKPEVLSEPAASPAPIAPAPKNKGKGAAKTVPAKFNAPLIPGGSYILQVAALRKQSDALALASGLQKKKFPAFVLSPQGDAYYRVQVGPYGDQKSAKAAQKGLESSGFKAIVKH